MSRFRLKTACLVVVLAVSVDPANVFGQGINLRGVGAVNESMAGAATAAPIDAAGAIHWNPASIAEFHHDEAFMGLALYVPDTRVESTVGVLQGASRGESGAALIPTMALVHRARNPRVTFGIGAYGIAGFKVNYDASLTNPILLPQGTLAPLPTLGRVDTSAEFYQIAPTIAVALNDCWSVGFAPTMTLGKIGIEPLLAAPPTGGIYPTGSGTRYHFGGGAQAGLYFKPNDRLRFGASIKTKQYFEDFNYKAQDINGLPVNARTQFEYPLIVSVGTSFQPSQDLLFAIDCRWFDYSSAKGFGTSGFNRDGSVAGVGWHSVLAVAMGVQKHVNQCLTVRAGYVWNDNPIHSDNMLLGAAAPVISQHVVTLGSAIRLAPNLILNTTYLHGFDNEASGPYAGLPGTNITIRTAAYALSSGLTIHY